MSVRRLIARFRLAWRKRRFSRSVALSLAIHAGIVALLVLVIAPAKPREVLHALLVDLVQMGESGDTNGLGAGDEAHKTASSQAASSPAPTPGGATRSGGPQPSNLGELLRLAETAHGAPAFTAAHPGGGVGAGGAADTGGGGGQAGLKDFIRAQIERRWQVDPAAAERVISLHLIITAEGNVTTARVVSAGDGTPAYRALALDARNAALLSSPLQFPPGLLEGATEVTVDLNTRDARR